VAGATFELLSRFFAQYGYGVVFFGVMLENAGVPVPGETVLLFAGFLAFQGQLRLIPAILAAMAGATIGDSLGFCIGRYGGEAFVNRYARRFDWASRRYDEAQRLMVKYGPWAVFTGRFITGLRVFAGPLAGALLMPYPRFLLFNFTGAVTWATAIGCAGFFFGASWQRLVRWLGRIDSAVLILLLAVTIVALITHRVRRKRSS
jgi:membrane-associated protein